MDLNGICLNCFSYRGEYEVCPSCGYIAGTPPREPYLLAPGKILRGRYIIGTVLGIGGFGVTYRAWDATLESGVAIKEFYPGGLVARIPGETAVTPFSGEKQQHFIAQMGRFLDEARNMAKFVGDKHVVNVFDFFEENNTAYIVMEFLDGQTLKERMAEQGGRLKEAEALSITESVLEALGSIHGKGIIHRDISPDNIFILKDGRVKVLDFGAARFAPNEGENLTQSAVVKLGYAPPEQYRTNLKQGVWTDIYAVGATLYKMLTGATPEESVDRSVKDTLKRPSELGVSVDSSVEKAVMKAMALRPELRFKSADQMLESIQSGTGAEFPEVELKRRKRIRTAVIAVAIAAVVGIGAYIGWGSSQPTADTLATLATEKDDITIALPEGYEQREILRSLAESFTETYPDYSIAIEDYSASSYTQALYGSGAPTLFLASELSAAPGAAAADLSLLLESIDTSSYWFLDRYEELYPSKNVMPTGMDVVLAYYNTSGEKIDSIPHTAQVSIIAESGGASLYREDAACLLLAVNPERLENGVFDSYPYDRGNLLLLAYEDGTLRSELNATDTVLHVGLASQLRDIQKLWPGRYGVIPVASDGVMTAVASDSWCVSSSASENQQKVAMLFLHYLLSEYSQNALYVQHDGCLPLNRAALSQYFEVNADLGFLAGELDAMNMYGEDMFAVNKGSGDFAAHIDEALAALAYETEPEPEPEPEEPGGADRFGESVAPAIFGGGTDISYLSVDPAIFGMNRAELTELGFTVEDISSDGYMSLWLFRFLDSQNSYVGYEDYNGEPEKLVVHSLMLSFSDLYGKDYYTLDELKELLGGKLQVESYYSLMEDRNVTNCYFEENGVHYYILGSEEWGFSAVLC